MKSAENIRQLSLTGNDLIIQDNSLIESPKNLTQQEFKLFLLLISKINPEKDIDFATFRVTVSEFAKALNLDQVDYNEFRKIARRLLKRTIEIRRPKAKHDTEFPILCKADYFYGKGYADLRINEELRPYLIQLKEQFTRYRLSYVLTLSSTYAIHLYEIMKRYEKLGVYNISIDEFKKIMKLDEHCYSKISNIRKNVLNIAQREINGKTDLMIDYSFEKTGRKFSSINFVIRLKNSEEAMAQILYLKEAKQEVSSSTIRVPQKNKEKRRTAANTLQPKEKKQMEISISKTCKNNADFNPTELSKKRRNGLTKIGDLLSDFFGSRKTK